MMSFFKPAFTRRANLNSTNISPSRFKELRTSRSLTQAFLHLQYVERLASINKKILQPMGDWYQHDHWLLTQLVTLEEQGAIRFISKHRMMILPDIIFATADYEHQLTAQKELNLLANNDYEILKQHTAYSDQAVDQALKNLEAEIKMNAVTHACRLLIRNNTCDRTRWYHSPYHEDYEKLCNRKRTNYPAIEIETAFNNLEIYLYKNKISFSLSKDLSMLSGHLLMAGFGNFDIDSEKLPDHELTVYLLIAMYDFAMTAIASGGDPDHQLHKNMRTAILNTLIKNADDEAKAFAAIEALLKQYEREDIGETYRKKIETGLYNYLYSKSLSHQELGRSTASIG